MSHELRTPLNAIIGFSQVLKQKCSARSTRSRPSTCEDILTLGRPPPRLINDILDLSKVEAGQVELESVSSHCGDALERGVVYGQGAGQQGTGSRSNWSSIPVSTLIEGDECRIRQVVFNLLSNAVKFTPRGGRVDVSTARANGEVKVSVGDTGPGIADDDRERIFEEFQQAESHQRGAPRGHRPRPRPCLRAWSSCTAAASGRVPSSGKGSTFTFTLPVEAHS